MRERNASRSILFFRWFVFLLAAGYTIRMLVFGSYEAAGGPFRFLTIWALVGSFFVASRLLALTEGRSDRRWDTAVAAVAVVNTMVTFLYWRLFLADPSSVTTDGQLGDFYLEMYLHGLGPALQVIDAVFLHRSFRRIWRAALLLIVIVAAYVAWAELFVQRFNDSPAGSVTSGLPYRFLNNLEFDGRAGFYVSNLVVAMALLLIYACLTWAVRRWVPPPIAP